MRDLLGHASILTTERYDNQRLEALQAAVARLEEGKVFDAVRLKPDPTYEEVTDNLSAEAVARTSAKAEVSRIFQVLTEQSRADGSDTSKEIFRSN